MSRQEFEPFADQMAAKYGLRPELFRAQIGAESNWRPGAVSRSGAIGLGQLMPGTAKELGVDPWDPRSNLEGAARYMAKMKSMFGGDEALMLAGYNAGPGAVQRAGGIPKIAETQNYVRKVLAAAGGPGQGGVAAPVQRAPAPSVPPAVALGPTGGFDMGSLLKGITDTAPDGGAGRMAAAGILGGNAWLAGMAAQPSAQPSASGGQRPRMAAQPDLLPELFTATVASLGGLSGLGLGNGGDITQTPLTQGTPARTGGPMKVGRISKPGEDGLPSTGPHLDVRIQKNGEYINPMTARSILQDLDVGGKPLFTQSGGDFQATLPITSGFGPRTAPTAGASTFHRGIDLGVEANTPLTWRGGGTLSQSPGIQTIDIERGGIPYRIKLLHTMAG